jgi:sugar diacid utilization regulator/putative methionine-R-sulfoxide reductase with GAF domain
MRPEPPDLPLDVLSALVDLGTELQAEEVDLARVLELATRNAARLLGTDIAWLSLFDDDTRTMRVAVSHGTTVPEFAHMKVSENEGLGGAAVQAGGPVIVADYASWASPGPIRDTVLAEGVCSALCAPMLRGDRVVGVLYAANRSPTQFTASDTAIVTALAAQASVAIGNGLLYSSLLDKTRTLEATFEIHRALGEAAVSDPGIDLVMRTLSEVTGRRLLLEQQVAPPFKVLSAPANDATGDETVASVVSVRRNGSAVGQITVFGPDPLGELEQNALSHGATVLALELMKHEAAQDVEWRLRGELLEQLLEAEDDRSDELHARARRFGIDLTEACSIVVVEARQLDPQALRGLIQRVITSHDANVHSKATLSGQRGDRGVIALIGDGHDTDRFVALLIDAGGGAVLWIGTSSGRSNVSASFREAAACSHLARQASHGKSRVIHGSALGPLRFILDIQDLTNASAFVDDVLGPVAAHEQAGGAQLLTTLRAYVEEDGHHQRVAGRCHVHVSTVKYRLARIAELLNRPLQPWETRFEITLAFRLADLLESLPDDRR